MGRRLELKAIVNDLTLSLGTRNNDFQGYWALGQLYSAALDTGVQHVHIDIFKASVEPDTFNINGIANTYKERILRQLKSRKMDYSWVVNAFIDYWFETEIDKSIHSDFGVGKPYIGQLTIYSDLGKSYSRKFGGYCKPHDPSIEKRRVGF